MCPRTGSKFIQTAAVFIFAGAATLSAAPQLGLSTTSIGPIHVFSGATGPTQSVETFNTGSGSLSLTTSVSAPWLTATAGSPQACTTRSGSCVPIQITLATSGLSDGAYTGYVTVTDPNAVDSPQQIAVNINVAGVPASVTLYVTPAGGPLPSTFLPIYTHGNVTGVATTQSGGNWLSFINGFLTTQGAPYAIQVAAQNGLAPGSYTGQIAVSGSNAADNKTIKVTLNVSSSPIIALSNNSTTLAGYPGGAKASTSVSFSNAGSGTLAITGATASSSTGNFLAATASGNTVTVTADAGTLSPGTYTGSVSLTSNAANNSQISIPVVFTVEVSGTPLIYSGGIVNIGDFAADGAAPGDILAVFGDQLAAPGTFAQNPGPPPLATSLGSVQVLINNVPAPLYFSSAGQVNFQLPYETPTGQTATIQVVSKGIPGNLRPLNVTASVPRLLVWTPGVIAGGYGIVVNQDYSLVLPSGTFVPGFAAHPAKAGDTLTIYCTGLGQTSPAGVTGTAATSSPLQSIANVTATFGGLFSGTPSTVAAFFAGLTPTAVGLYQVNATIPPDTPVGALIPVTVNVNGAVSNPVYIAVTE
jgi:uncharacterized protein (TIGR03437 family)